MEDLIERWREKLGEKSNLVENETGNKNILSSRMEGGWIDLRVNEFDPNKFMLKLKVYNVV